MSSTVPARDRSIGDFALEKAGKAAAKSSELGGNVRDAGAKRVPRGLEGVRQRKSNSAPVFASMRAVEGM